MSKRGLGRGLSALLSSGPEILSDDNVQVNAPGVTEIVAKEIQPNHYQPRREFDPAALEELVQSIQQHGILQPLIVRKKHDGYELVAGERRLRAAQKAGLERVPVILKQYTDLEMMEIALIENLQREDLNPIEQALAFRRLINEFGLTQEDVAKQIGRSRPFIANVVRLLNLHELIQEYISKGKLSMGQVRPLLAIEDYDLQLELAEHIIEQGFSARDAEELVRKMTSKEEVAQSKKQVVANKEIFIAEAEDRLKILLGTQVRIKPGKIKSKIEIEYYSNDDLDRLVEALSPQEQHRVNVATPKSIVV